MSPRHFPVIALSLAFSLTGATAQQPGPSRIERWDRNGDGKLSREEVPEPLRKNFDRVDKDGDGFVSKEEDAAIGQGPGGGPGPREGVKKLADLDYAGTGNPRQTLDLYLPEKRVGSELLPLIVFIHGGAWQGGDKNGGGAKVGAYVASGKYAGASIGYRLSGEAQWPSQIHDCKAAIRWLKAHAGKYGLDPDRIAVW
ncbi:MAG: alpha/beta hydrolase fold domain-containing protein, partial [Verrucomicrobiales bacterium]|nr:alpha/beta hydrolase fold domain-containing protein [Verrucomicrobiales bacterium]